ncbi:MAG: efflux RND transporter permease subunit, partial [Planctomycetes bacterium]|nr:efflux RND transporter permease subunit [Planctomycetota bacterium]
MLNAVIRFALHYRMLVMMVSLALMGYGTYLASTMSIDVFPDLDRPRVVIITECRGLAPEEVETLVTQQIEIALLGANGVQDIRSQSAPELSVIYVEFNWTTDIRIARQTVQERLATLEGLLPEVARPQMAPTASIMGQIVVAGMYRQEGPRGGELAPVPNTNYLAERFTDASASILVWEPRDRRLPDTWRPVKLDGFEWQPARPDFTGERRAALTIAGLQYEVVFPSPVEQQMSLRTTADWVVRPRLLKVPGVAEIFILGGERKQYQVLLDPAALLEYDVTLQQVEQALKDNNLNTSGGFAIRGETERPIRVFGRLGPEPGMVIEELRKVPLRATPKRTILLEEVARVVEGPQVKRGDGSVNGRPGVVLTIAKQPHVDTRELTDRITAA